MPPRFFRFLYSLYIVGFGLNLHPCPFTSLISSPNWGWDLGFQQQFARFLPTHSGRHWGFGPERSTCVGALVGYLHSAGRPRRFSGLGPNVCEWYRCQRLWAEFSLWAGGGTPGEYVDGVRAARDPDPRALQLHLGWERMFDGRASDPV